MIIIAKRLIGLFLITVALTQQVSAAIISNVIVQDDLITITGKLQYGNENSLVSIFLLQKGKTLQDLSTADVINDVVINCNIVSANKDGSYKYSFKFTGTSGDYLLYVKSQSEEYSMTVDPTKNNILNVGGDIYINSGGSAVVSRISVSNRKITIEGNGDIESRLVSIFLLKNGKTLEDLANAPNISDVASQCDIIYADFDGYYKYSFESINTYGDCLLYIKSGAEERTIMINPANDQTIKFIKELYVSVSGNDNNAGTENSPLATMDGARRKVKSIKDSSLPITVVFHGGTYNFASTAVFDSSDSGTSDKIITYKAAVGEKVIFTGTTKLDISSFTPASDIAIQSRLPDLAKNKVLKMDLANQGITKAMVDMTTILSDPAMIGQDSKPLGFYLNDKRQPLSRWPNVGYAIIGTVTNDGGRASGNAVPFLGEGGSDDCAEFTSNDANPWRWSMADDLCIEGFLGTDWHGEWAKVKSIDSVNNKITLQTWTAYGVAAGLKWSAVNLLDEIDMPGEWYVDKNTMTLYYYPAYTLDPERDIFELATLLENFITINNAKYINFEGLDFSKNGADNSIRDALARNSSSGIEINNSSYINIKDCEFSNIGHNGIYINGTDITVNNCSIYNVGLNGIAVVDCGVRSTLTSCNNTISNNQIYNISRDSNDNAVAGIKITHGVGTVVENNIIHNLPNSAIRYGGNENIIRYNEFYRVMNKVADAGAIYAGYNWSEYGTVIEYNYFHDLGPSEMRTGSASANAIFWDDTHSGNTAKNNIIVFGNKNNSAAVKIGGGKDNIVKENTFVNSSYGIIGEDRTIAQGLGIKNTSTYNSLTQVPYNQPPFTIKYPNMSSTYADIETNKAFLPKNTMINNLYTDVPRDSINSGVRNNSVISKYTNANGLSIFVDAQNQDYRIKKANKAALGITENILDEDFNINLIGIQEICDGNVGDFKLLYPQNGMLSADNNVNLSWEQSDFADEYEYTVATDSNFTSITASGRTKDTIKSITNLAENTLYFWKVKAINGSRQIGCEKDSTVNYFSTSDTAFQINSTTFYDTENIEITSLIGKSGNIRLNLKLTNKTGEAQPIELLYAIKDNAGKLISCGIGQGNVIVDDEMQNFDLIINLKETYKSNSKFEVYIWKLDKQLVPIVEKTVF